MTRHQILAAWIAALAGMDAPSAARAEMPTAAEPCLACHGERGVAQQPEMPSLAGQQAAYLSLQLTLFREGLRQVEPMTPAARDLGDADIERLAAYFAGLQPAAPPDRGPRDPALYARGAALAETGRCGSCHGAGYRGAEHMARLAGQREDYLLHALVEYRDNRRQGFSSDMAGVLHGLSDAELGALAHFLAQQE